MTLPETFAHVVTIIGPSAALVVAGVLLGRRGRLPPPETFGLLLTDVATPCLVLSSFAHMRFSPALIGPAVAAALLCLTIFVGVSFVLLRICRLRVCTYLGPLSFPNTGNLGIPLAAAAFGPIGLGTATIVYAVFSVANCTLGQALAAGRTDWTALCRMPLVYASIAGFVIAWRGIVVPGVVASAIGLAGQLAIPLMLLSLGAAMARLDLPDTCRPALLGGFRLGMGAVVGLAVTRLLGLHGAAEDTVILQAAMPVAINSYLFAQRWNCEPHEVASLVTASTLVSCVTTPLLLALMPS